MQGRFEDNPAYVEYETLLKRLHQLIANGQGDSEAADAIRDQMDAPESRLDRREKSRLNGLSADLYMLQRSEVLEKPPVAQNQDELREQIKEYEQINDWDSVLALLRRRPVFVSDEAVAFTRARAYAALGHHDTALLFFEFAMKSRAASPDFQAMHLFMLKNAGRLQEAVEIGARYAAAPPASPVVLIADAINRFEKSGANEARQILAQVSRAIKAVGPNHPTLLSYVVLAYLLAAQCLMLLGNPAEAIAALDEALKFRPGDAGILQAREAVAASGHADASESFKRASANVQLAIYLGEPRTITYAPTVWGRAA